VDRVPLAMRRPPSPITREPDGSAPLNYYRLVKIPVFDKKCQGCHEKSAKHVNLDPLAPDNMEKSGTLMMPKLVKYFDAAQTSPCGMSPPRTSPGSFGAIASPLMNYLRPEHHGVRLNPEEVRRVIVWLDCNSICLSSYNPHPENIERQRRGEVVWPELDVEPTNPTGIQTALDGLYDAATGRERVRLNLADWRKQPDAMASVPPYDDPKVVVEIRGVREVAKALPYLGHAIPQYRYEAILQLSAIGDASAVEHLRAMVRSEPYPIVLAEVIRAMDNLDAPSSPGTACLVELCGELGPDVNRGVNREAWFRLLRAMDHLDPARVKAVALTLCRDSQPADRRVGVQLLENYHIRGTDVEELLIALSKTQAKDHVASDAERCLREFHVALQFRPPPKPANKSGASAKAE
jgi:hypothetical protein